MTSCVAGTLLHALEGHNDAVTGVALSGNGQILASSVPVPSIWASPEDMDHDPAKLAALAKVLGMSSADLQARVADKEKSCVWLKRLAGEEVAAQVKALGL